MKFDTDYNPRPDVEFGAVAAVTPDSSHERVFWVHQGKLVEGRLTLLRLCFIAK